MTAAQAVRFGALTIDHDSSVLTPRPWTVAQSLWASELLWDLPDGPVLELCCGAGQIGLHAVREHPGRHLVAVDANPEAIRWTEHNARINGGSVETRHQDLREALRDDERFALVIADPPWVTHDDVGRFPEDPLLAIDGGSDGLAVARLCLEVAARHVLPHGALLLQLGSEAQIDDLSEDLDAANLTETGRFVLAGRGVVVCLTLV